MVARGARWVEVNDVAKGIDVLDFFARRRFEGVKKLLMKSKDLVLQLLAGFLTYQCT